MSAEKVIQIAREEVGYLEKKSNKDLYNKTANAGSNNYTKYGAWYDNGKFQAQPWCDMFVSWCADQAGEAAAVGHYAYVPSHQNFFENQGRWHLKSGYTPVPGDVIIFRNESHIGFVEYVSGGYVHTIEGNTSGGSTLVANGGGVFQKSYPLTSSYILGYGHPAYSSEAEKKKYTVGWNKDAQGWWYADSATTYYKDEWAKIDGKWYVFNDKGYMEANMWKLTNGQLYYVGDSGAMVTDMSVKIDSDGKLVPTEKETRYYYLKELPTYYREEIDPLIASGVFKGKGGSGENLIVDMSEDGLRSVIIAARVKNS